MAALAVRGGTKHYASSHPNYWKATLVVLGGLGVAAAILVWVWGSTNTQTVTTISTPTTAVSAGGSANRPPATTKTVQKTHPETVANSSDTIVLGLTGIGIILLLAGAFFDRISTITLPGGPSISLTPAGAASAAKAIAKHTEKGEQGSRTAEKAFPQFMTLLQSEPNPESLTDQDIDHLMERSIELSG